MSKLLLLSLLLLSPGVFATDDDCNEPHNQCGHDDGDGTTTTAGADASSEATGGDATGSATVNTKSENTSLVLSGARDTAPCFTKITIGAEGFGIGFSRSDSYCKKVRLIARQIEGRNYDAAARLECTLKEWREVFGKDKDKCYWAILIEDPPPPDDTDDDANDETSGGIAGQLLNDAWFMADVTEDEYRAEQEERAQRERELEARLARQERAQVAQQKEIDAALAERDERLAKEQDRKNDFRLRYEQRVEQDTEDDGEPEK